MVPRRVGHPRIAETEHPELGYAQDCARLPKLPLPDLPQSWLVGHRIEVRVVDLPFLASGAGHQPSAHAPRSVVQQHAAGGDGLVVRVRTNHEYGNMLELLT